MSVESVGRPSVQSQTLWYIKEPIQGRKHIVVVSVEKPLCSSHSLLYTRVFI